MKCPSCNKEVSPDWIVCPYCKLKPTKCSNTTHQPLWLLPSVKHCPICGKPIGIGSKEDFVVSVRNISFKMIYIEGGTFQMGATPEQGFNLGFLDLRRPVHSVELSDYYLAETVVTQALWKDVTDEYYTSSIDKLLGKSFNPSEGVDLPVDCVSWNNCDLFIQKLNQLTHMSFRFPTEAEWEYAARGGNQNKQYLYSGGNNIDTVAWYSENSEGKTHPVKTKSPNALGIYDMSGNVREWCKDRNGRYNNQHQINPQGPSSGRWRVYRGGSYLSAAYDCLVSCRNYDSPDTELFLTGLRLALSVF